MVAHILYNAILQTIIKTILERCRSQEKGNTVEQKISNQYLIKYIYDLNNNLIKEERYYANGLLDEQTEYEYDENNKLVLENNFVTKTKYVYEYFE